MNTSLGILIRGNLLFLNSPCDISSQEVNLCKTISVVVRITFDESFVSSGCHAHSILDADAVAITWVET